MPRRPSRPRPGGSTGGPGLAAAGAGPAVQTRARALLVTLLAVLVGSGGVSALLGLAARATFDGAVLQRRDYRGVDVPVGAGMVAVLAVVATVAVLVVADVAGRTPAAGEVAGRTLALVATLGFGLLGLFDDWRPTATTRASEATSPPWPAGGSPPAA